MSLNMILSLRAWLGAWLRGLKFTAVSLKALADQVFIRYQCVSSIKLFIFIFWVLSAKEKQWRNSHKYKHLLSRKNDGIFHTFDQIKVFKGTVVKSGIIIFA